MADCVKNILDIPVDSSLITNTEVVIFTRSDGTTVIRTWAVILAAITPSDIEFQVAVTPGAPGDGDATYTNTALIGKRIRVFRQFLKQTQLTIAGGYRWSFNNATGVVTFTPNLSFEEVIQIEIY